VLHAARWKYRTHKIAILVVTDCMQLPQQTKKTLQQNPFAHHQRSVKVSDDVSRQDKIGLHHFDNYLSRVKINVAKVNN